MLGLRSEPSSARSHCRTVSFKRWPGLTQPRRKAGSKARVCTRPRVIWRLSLARMLLRHRRRQAMALDDDVGGARTGWRRRRSPAESERRQATRPAIERSPDAADVDPPGALGTDQGFDTASADAVGNPLLFLETRLGDRVCSWMQRSTRTAGRLAPSPWRSRRVQRS